MIDHISVAVADVLRSSAFCDAVFAPLGINRLWTADGAAGYGYPGADEAFAIKQNNADEPVCHSSRTHIAFTATTREAIETFHSRALDRGGADEGARTSSRVRARLLRCIHQGPRRPPA